MLSFFGLRQTRVFARESDLVMGSDARQVEASCSGSASSPEPLDFPEPEPVAKREDEYDEIRAKGRYRRSGLTEERADVISTRLETFMREERPYLDAELTIERLAKRMAVPRHHLTQVISERHGKNFYLFVNEYRIQCVKQALKAPETQGATLLEVAYASGFNSKSTFNTAFKRLTGMTPSQYRRQMS